MNATEIIKLFDSAPFSLELEKMLVKMIAGPNASVPLRLESVEFFTLRSSVFSMMRYVNHLSVSISWSIYKVDIEPIESQVIDLVIEYQKQRFKDFVLKYADEWPNLTN